MAKCPKCEHTVFEVENYPFSADTALSAICCAKCNTVISFVDPYVVSVKVISLHRDVAKIAHCLNVSLE